MKKLWKTILKYKVYIVLTMLLLFMGFMFVTFYKYMHPKDNTTKYGDRLDGIEKVKISDNKQKDIIKFIEEDKNFTKVIIDIRGRIINISFDAKDKKNTIEKLQEKCDDILKQFSEEEIKFYDFQFFITNEEANYKMIGYKNKNKDKISYSSDLIKREVEKDEKEQ